MRFLVELDGPVFDVAGTWYQAHRSAAAGVGWSMLDQGTFWRLLRTGSPEGNFLPGAKPVKASAYVELFATHVESDGLVETSGVHADVAESLRTLARFGAIIGITLGTNVGARRRVLERLGLGMGFERIERLDSDPRRRPAELVALAERDPRAMVLAGTDTVVRSADAGGLFSLGVSCGTCTAARLHRAGPRLVVPDLAHFAAQLRSGGGELVRAGLLPFGAGDR